MRNAQESRAANAVSVYTRGTGFDSRVPERVCPSKVLNTKKNAMGFGYGAIWLSGLTAPGIPAVC